eukprot:s2230_g1.t1
MGYTDILYLSDKPKEVRVRLRVFASNLDGNPLVVFGAVLIVCVLVPGFSPCPAAVKTCLHCSGHGESDCCIERLLLSATESPKNFTSTRQASATTSVAAASAPAVEEPGEPEEILTPLERVAKLPWEKQEKIYAMLLRVLERLRDQPEEPKFRSLSAKSSKLQQELLEPPGGESLLLWCGFALQGDRYLAPGTELDFGARHEELTAHATRERDRAFRAARDQRIEAEKLKALPTGDFGPPLRRWGGRLPGFGFGAHRLASAGMQCSKIMTRDPQQLRGFQLLDLGVASYQLNGVVQHIGSTPFSGHYVAYCWHHASSRWHCFDDARVRPVDPATVLEALNEAYVFFFEQAARARSLFASQVRLEQARATPSASCPACSGADRATDGGGATAIVGGAHYPTLLRPRSEGREFSLLATAFDPQIRGPLFGGTSRQHPPSMKREGPRLSRKAEESETEESRNRQKELQEIIVTADNVETILSTVRELEGAIVISTALHRLGKVPVGAHVFRDPRFHLLLDPRAGHVVMFVFCNQDRFKSRLPFFGSRQIANSLHGLGAVCYRGKGPWVEMVSIQTQRRVHEFEPQHVSNTLWACARMQLHEPLMLRALTCRAIEDSTVDGDIQRFCPLDISICTWAFATMKHREPEWLRAVVRARCEFADFSPQNMSNFVWGLSTLGFRHDAWQRS